MCTRHLMCHIKYNNCITLKSSGLRYCVSYDFYLPTISLIMPYCIHNAISTESRAPKSKHPPTTVAPCTYITSIIHQNLTNTSKKYKTTHHALVIYHAARDYLTIWPIDTRYSHCNIPELTVQTKNLG